MLERGNSKEGGTASQGMELSSETAFQKDVLQHEDPQKTTMVWNLGHVQGVLLFHSVLFCKSCLPLVLALAVNFCLGIHSCAWFPPTTCPPPSSSSLTGF